MTKCLTECRGISQGHGGTEKCGRYTMHHTPEQVQMRFGVTEARGAPAAVQHRGRWLLEDRHDKFRLIWMPDGRSVSFVEGDTLWVVACK